jgi:uncharacterized protein (TIGR02284 family)
LDQLLDLVQMLRDGGMFCAAAAGDCDDAPERDLLRAIADTKTLMARDVTSVLPAREAELPRDGVELRQLRDAYLRARASLRAHRNGEFARMLQGAERRVLDALWDALCSARDPTVQHVLERQYGRALQAHERIRELQRSTVAPLAGRSAAA